MSKLTTPRILSLLNLFALALVLALNANFTVCLAQQRSAGQRVRPTDLFVDRGVLNAGLPADYPLTARAGEVIIITVSSDVFDPVAELLNASGARLAENDDAREGVQDSLLLAEIGAAGEYRVRVRAFSQTGSGQFTITVRRFVPTATVIGARTPATVSTALVNWHRFPVEAGQTLVVTSRSAAFAPSLEIYAPNGASVEPAPFADDSETNTARIVFRAARAGTYYARIAPASGNAARASYVLTVAPARVSPLTLSSANECAAGQNVRLDAGGLDLWTFQAQAGTIVRLCTESAGGPMNVNLSFIPPNDEASETVSSGEEADVSEEAASGGGTNQTTPARPFVVLPTREKPRGEVIALLNRTGTYQFAVSQPLGLSAEYALLTAQPVRPASAAETGSALRIGDSDYWSFDGARSAVIRFEALSETFDPTLELYNTRGERIATNDDGGVGMGAVLTALLIEPGRYLMRVHSFGGGGGGRYALRRVANPTRQIAPNGRAEGSVGAAGAEIYTFEGRAGQLVIISVSSSDFDPRVQLYGTDAVLIADDDDGGEGTDSLLAARTSLSAHLLCEASATLFQISRKS